jgi:hypothetical protein
LDVLLHQPALYRVLLLVHLLRLSSSLHHHLLLLSMCL